MDAACRVECCFCRLELLEACLCCMALEYCREAESLVLPCRMLGDTGNSCWKMPCSDQHGMTRDEPCSCSISCGRINSVCRITWSCWIACGNTVVLVEYTVFEDLCNSCRNCWIVCGNTTVSVLEDRLKNLSLDLLSPLLWK